MKQLLLMMAIAFTTLPLLAQTEEAPSGKLSGNFFIDYYYNAVRDSLFSDLPNKAVPGEQDVHGLQIRRIYLTYDYRFNSKFSSRFRLESDEANFTASSSNKASKFGMFVKDAFVKWKYADGHDVTIGIQGTPAFEVSETVWENRYIEKTIMDLRKIVPSRDMAISFKGKIDNKGLFKYWLMYGNNNAGTPENDKYKRYFAQIEVSPVKNLVLTLYSDLQTRSKFANTFVVGEKLSNNTITSAFFAGYRKKDVLSVGVEAYLSTTQNGYIVKVLDENDNHVGNIYNNGNGLGLSVFGNYYFSKKYSAFGRFDRFDPNNDADGDSRNLLIAGFAIKPVEKFTISPNIFVESFEKVGDVDIKSSVTPRITASWAF
jgi:hypothetical protein